MFKSIGHFFATVFQKALPILAGIQKTETAVEAVTNAVYGPLAVSAEKAAYALMGEVAAALTAGGDAVKAKLTDAGLDIKVIETVEAVLASVPQFVALAKK